MEEREGDERREAIPASLSLGCPVLGGARQAGIDEAGCGALLGSLVAAAVVLPSNIADEPVARLLSEVRDSKRLTEKRRTDLASRIRAHALVGVGRVTAAEIDANGLGWARREVFQRALQRLPAAPDAVLVDGNGFFDGCAAHPGIPYRLEPKADAKYANVAAASIVAKDFRDSLVRALCVAHPVEAALFGWASNKGYATAAHKSAIEQQGVTTAHRRSFEPCASSTKQYPVALDESES